MTRAPFELLDAPPSKADLVIVGAGVIGAATAFAARKEGLTAVVIEARPALASATTAVATGAYRLQQDDPDELAIIRETVEAMQAFEDYTGQARYDPLARPAGLMSLTTTPEGAEQQRETVEHQRSIGVDGIELLDGDEARDRFPYLAPEVLQARLRMGDGLLDQRQLALGLLHGAGAPIVTRCRATGFETATGELRAVLTDRGRIATRTCVIATGPVSGALARLAGVELPIETHLRHRLVMPDVPQVPPWAPLTFDEDTGAHWRPALNGAYVLISEAEQWPSDPVDDPATEPGFAYRVLDPSSPTSVARLSPFWREVWEDARAAWTVQAGLYTVTPDHRPLIGETPVPGLFVNTGYSGHGVMSSIGGARHLLERISGTGAEVNPFAVHRTFVPPRGKTR